MKIHAYDEIYLQRARKSLGRMFDYAIIDLGYKLEEVWQMFLDSPISKQFENGDASIIAGKSGIELALIIVDYNLDYVTHSNRQEKGKEYWLGYVLAYYQWYTCLDFDEITEFITITEIESMYNPYHEMDVRQFCDELTRIINSRKIHTNLKRRRNLAGISQSELAKITGIPVRTIQQYEQRQKNINNAKSEYIVSLARALYCEPKSLLELS